MYNVGRRRVTVHIKQGRVPCKGRGLAVRAGQVGGRVGGHWDQRAAVLAAAREARASALIGVAVESSVVCLLLGWLCILNRPIITALVFQTGGETRSRVDIGLRLLRIGGAEGAVAQTARCCTRGVLGRLRAAAGEAEEGRTRNYGQMAGGYDVIHTVVTILAAEAACILHNATAFVPWI